MNKVKICEGKRAHIPYLDSRLLCFNATPATISLGSQSSSNPSIGLKSPEVIWEPLTRSAKGRQKMVSSTHHHPPGSIPPPLHHLPVRHYRIREGFWHLARHLDRSPSQGLLCLALHHQHLPLCMVHHQKRLMLRKRRVKW